MGTSFTSTREVLERDAEMAKIAAYYTDSTEYQPKQNNVYHDHDDCPSGMQIKPQDRKFGTALRPRCDACKALD
jgi:hypothetical protein